MFVVNVLDRERASLRADARADPGAILARGDPAPDPDRQRARLQGRRRPRRDARVDLWPADESGKPAEGGRPGGPRRRGGGRPADAGRSDRRDRRRSHGDLLREGRAEPRPDRDRAPQRASSRASCFPVLCAAGARNIGAQPILNAILGLLPEPGRARAVRGQESRLGHRGPARGQVDRARRPRSSSRRSRTPTPGASRSSASIRASSSTTVAPERRSRQRPSGSARSPSCRARHPFRSLRSAPATSARSPSSRTRSTGDTLTDKDHPIAYEPVHFPTPAISFAIEPKTKGDEEKISSVAAAAVRGGLGPQFGRDPMTHELLLSGTGLEHVKVAVGPDEEEVRRRGVAQAAEGAVPRDDPRARPSRCTATRSRRAAPGSSPRCTCASSLCPRGGGFEFTSEVFGGAISRNFWPSIEKGIRSGDGARRDRGLSRWSTSRR